MSSKLEKLNLSSDELDRFKKAMEDPQFRSLLQEYTEEISNPANRAEHERYLAEVEERARRGEAEPDDYAAATMIPKGTKLIHPTPVFCMKVVVPKTAPRRKDLPSNTGTGREKIFVNLCTCYAMDDVTTQKVSGDDKKGGKNPPKAGEQFSLPYLLTGPRDTKDTRGQDATVYDFIFSESTWEQYKMHMRVVSMFQDMAIEAIEEKEGLTKDSINKSDIIILKNTTFKGSKPPPRLFKVSEEKEKEMKARDEKEKKTATSVPPTSAGDKKSITPASNDSSPALKEVSSVRKETPKLDPRAVPSHTITHRGYYSMTDQMKLSRDEDFLAALIQGRPKELIVKIQLPLIDKISEVNLDQSAQQILLTSIQYYFLLPLPYPVQPDQGQAKWNSKLKQLVVTMLVDQPSVEEIERYKSQRAQFDQVRADRDEASKKEKLAEEEREKAEEEQRRIHKEQEEQAERERAAAAAAAAEKLQKKATPDQPTRISIDEAKSAESPVALKTPSPPSAQPHHSVLKTSRLTSPHHSPAVGPTEEKHVRFSFSDAELESGISERDGPLGPKPVGKLLVEEIQVHSSNKKGHKKKHIPGTEGPEAWTGVGKEPSKEIAAYFPPIAVESPTQAQANSHHSHGKKNNKSSGANGTGVAWPNYTYSQSPATVVLVIKVAGIKKDSVKMSVSESSAPSSPGGSASNYSTRSIVDLSFVSSSAPSKPYRLYLPLAYPILKASYDVNAKNMLLNLSKAQAPLGEKQEWSSLLDYSILGDFDADGTPLSSPAASPITTMPNMDELSLGPTQHQEKAAVQVEANETAPPASTPAPALTMKPIELAQVASLLNPFVAIQTNPSTSAAMTTARSLPSNELLFQLD